MRTGGEADVEGVELADVAWLAGHVVAGFAAAVVAQELPAASSGQAGRLVQGTATTLLAEDASDHDSER